MDMFWIVLGLMNIGIGIVNLIDRNFVIGLVCIAVGIIGIGNEFPVSEKIHDRFDVAKTSVPSDKMSMFSENRNNLPIFELRVKKGGDTTLLNPSPSQLNAVTRQIKK
mgnify:CR=1 FL=1|jgi:hypothetical protein